MKKRPADEQKARELGVLRHLLQYGEITAEIVEEREAPDFILELDGRRIGVEVTDFIRGRTLTGSPQRAQHQFIGKVLQLAKAAYDSGNTDPIVVTVHAAEGRAAQRPEALAAILATRVERCLMGEYIESRRTLESLLGGSAFRDCEVPAELRAIVERLTVVPLTRGSVSRWRIPQSGDTEAFAEEMTAVIASKEGRVSHYLTVCEEVWLVVDVFGGDILQAITPTAGLANQQYRTSFTKVSLVDTTETPRIGMRLSELRDLIVEDFEDDRESAFVNVRRAKGASSNKGDLRCNDFCATRRT